MAKIVKRTWRIRWPLGRPVTRVAYGYTLMVSGRQERKVSSAWQTETEALEALAARQREVEAGQLDRPRQDRTLGAVVVEYLPTRRTSRSGAWPTTRSSWSERSSRPSGRTNAGGSAR